MGTKDVLEKKEKSLVELIVIVILLTVLMAVFLGYYFKHEQKFSDTGFHGLANNFSSKVQVVHAQWLMDKQPSSVKVKGHQINDIEIVTVNKNGWLDVDFDRGFSSKVLIQPCQRIWQLALGIPQSLIKQPVSAVQVKRGGHRANGGYTGTCRYQLASGLYFDYDTRTGKVEMGEK